MKTKHTAQWHVAKTGNHQGLIVDDDGRNIAVAYDSADAPLIASAPELYEALQAIIKTCEAGVLHRVESGNPPWSALPHIEGIARAAIAKATP